MAISDNKEPTKEEKDELPRLKKLVEESREFFNENNERFHYWRNFVFNSSLNEQDKAALVSMNKPQLEFNIMEAYISRLRGEFSKQEPSIKVSANDGAEIDLPTMHAVEGYIRHELFEANKDGCEYQTYTDTLSGGYSVWKVWTEYLSSSSFNQVIKFGRVYEPTMTGFDSLARKPTKCDGRFCFELYPKTEDELKLKYDFIEWDKIKYSNTVGGFSWTYKSGSTQIYLLCDFYEKEKKNKTIFLLSNGKTMEKKKYEEFVEKFEQENPLLPAPTIVKKRVAQCDTIIRYVFLSGQMLECEETDFEDLPLIFVDGNSINLKKNSYDSLEQMTRPYPYHLEGTQRLKNFAGQSLGNELQSLVQHKFIVSKESIPPQYQEAYRNYQVPSVIVYNEFLNNDPAQRLTPPREVQRTPIPPEIMGTFNAMDNLSQVILGSFDASLGINDNQLSGIAIQEGATQSNSAAMPYVVSFLEALNQVAKIFVNLIPKYYVTPRTIPVLDADSRRSFVRINDQEDPNSFHFNFEKDSLNVKVEAGASFSVQKSKALNQIIAGAQAMPIFGQFINEKGLGVFVRNLECKDSDQLQVMADQYMNELQEMKQQQQEQQQNMPNPLQLKAQQSQQELALRAQKQQMDAQLESAKIGISQQAQDNNRLRIMLEAKQNHNKNVLQASKQMTEKERAAADLALSIAGHHHKANKEMIDLTHQISKSAAEMNAPENNAAQSSGEIA